MRPSPIPTLSIRIDFGPSKRLGPGKVMLLEAIAEHGSISAAARSIGMSYKRAWDLIDELNAMFKKPVIDPKSGGKSGGGAALTETGQFVVATYREIEKISATATSAAIKQFSRAAK